MESMIARQAGFNTVHQLYDVGTCYQYEMKPIEHESMIELYFGTAAAPRGYVWMFPKADKRANVGIGIGGHLTDGIKNGGIKGAAPKEYLDMFIQKNERFRDASTLTDFGGVISVGAPIKEFVKDNVMVIGTAAKQVDPIDVGWLFLAFE
jgi:digeranylgeranylglycerophospholipid reductase